MCERMGMCAMIRSEWEPGGGRFYINVFLLKQMFGVLVRPGTEVPLRSKIGLNS